MAEGDGTRREFIKEVIREEFRPPERAYVVEVHEHTQESDPWNHEVTIRTKPPQAETRREVPVATSAPGEVRLPSDLGLEASLTDGGGDGNSNTRPQDQPECLVEYQNGDPAAPVVTGWLYSDEHRSPLGGVNDWRNRIGEAVVDIRHLTTREGGGAEQGGEITGQRQVIQVGKQPADGSAIDYGVAMDLTNDEVTLTGPSGETIQDTGDGWSLPARFTGSGSGGTGDPGSGTPGQLPDTDPSGTPLERAEQAGFDIQNTVQVSQASDITGAANTLYVVDGELHLDSGQIDLGGVDDTAICGKNNAVLVIPEGFRSDYAVHSGDAGSGFMWSGIDIDQTAPGAYGRIYGRCDDRGFIEYVETTGTGRRTDAENITGQPIPGEAAGSWLQLGVTTDGGTSRIKNCVSDHAGVLADGHEGDRPIGLNLQPGHRGTLNIVNSRFEAFPNNGVYATNIRGTVNITNSDAINCGVAGFRIARGTIEGCTVQYDHENTSLGNADAPGHASQGLATQDLGHGSNITVTDCQITIPNMARCGGGIDCRSGRIETIENTGVSMGTGTGGAPDVIIDGSCGTIRGCTFEGSATTGVSIQNNGPAVTLSDNTYNYTGDRGRVVGPTN